MPSKCEPLTARYVSTDLRRIYRICHTLRIHLIVVIKHVAERLIDITSGEQLSAGTCCPLDFVSQNTLDTGRLALTHPVIRKDLILNGILSRTRQVPFRWQHGTGVHGLGKKLETPLCPVSFV